MEGSRGESNTSGTVIAHVSEDHGLHVHSGAPPLRDVVQGPRQNHHKRIQTYVTNLGLMFVSFHGKQMEKGIAGYVETRTFNKLTWPIHREPWLDSSPTPKRTAWVSGKPNHPWLFKLDTRIYLLRECKVWFFSWSFNKFEFLDNQVPVGLCTLIHPGIEDCTNGSPKLRFWILWELLAKLQLDHGFVRLDQLLQILWKQLTVLQGMISLKMKNEIEGRKVSGKRWKSYESREVSGHPK